VPKPFYNCKSVDSLIENIGHIGYRPAQMCIHMTFVYEHLHESLPEMQL